MFDVFYYILAGLLGTLNMVLWGVYGDLLVEKFYVRKVLRSLVIGTLWSVFLFFINPNLPLLIVAMAVISLERITTEIYKPLIRSESQDKYKIPSDLKINFGRNLKLFFGLSFIAILIFFVYFIELPINNLYLTIIAGLIVGVGGMVKDAPFEGFDPVKFFRSPAICVAVGILLAFLFPSVSGKYFLLAITGGERIISEFYKKILKGRIPGKFKKTEINKNWERRRRWLLVFYAADLFLFVALAV